MTEYIEREKAIKPICEACNKQFPEEPCEPSDCTIMQILRSIPAADVREVVTCEECDWHVDCGYHYCNKWCQPCPDNADFFCAYGERPNCGADMRDKED